MRGIGEADVIGHEQVEVAVPVHVEKGDAGAHLVPASHARLGGHIFQGAVAAIVQEHVGAEIADVDVRPAVVVVVGHGHSQPEAGLGNAGFFRRINEMEPAHVPVQCVAWTRSLPLHPGKRDAVDEVDVDQPVPVVVEGRQTGAHRLDQVTPAAGAVRVLERNARLPGHVLELDGTLGPDRGARHEREPHCPGGRENIEEEPPARRQRQRTTSDRRNSRLPERFTVALSHRVPAGVRSPTATIHAIVSLRATGGPRDSAGCRDRVRRRG